MSPLKPSTGPLTREPTVLLSTTAVPIMKPPGESLLEATRPGQPRLEFADLAAYEWMDAPAWVFDLGQYRHWWTNAAGLRFWRAENMQEVCERSYEETSPACKARLVLSMQAHARGETTCERWTLYPGGVPTSILLQGTGIRLPDGRVGILFMVAPTVQIEPDVARGAEALNHAAVQVAVHRLADGVALMRNPAAALAFGAVTQGGSADNDFVAMFADRTVGELHFARLKAGEAIGAKAMLRSAGAPGWHWIGACVAPDPVSGEAAVQVHCTDISELMAAQQALELARRHAEAASRAKATFIATMNHEIRTPLNGLLGMLHALDRGQLDDRQHRQIRMALDGGKALATLLSDVIEFAAMESSNHSPAHELLDPRAVIEVALRPLQPEAMRKGLSLSHTIAADMPEFVVGDERWLRQIVFNLAANAVKFTSRGSVQVLAAAQLTEDGAHCLRIDFVDTGIGIPAPDHETIFKPFVHLDQGLSRRYSGCGMGLALVRSMVERLGGYVELESASGRGSRFTLVLPVT